MRVSSKKCRCGMGLLRGIFQTLNLDRPIEADKEVEWGVGSGAKMAASPHPTPNLLIGCKPVLSVSIRKLWADTRLEVAKE